MTSNPELARRRLARLAGHRLGVTDSHSSFKASLGAPVNMVGKQTLEDGRAFSLAVGRQFTYRQDNGEEWPLRVEFENWSGRYDRTSLALGMLAIKPNDTVKAQVQFLNAAVRLGASDEKVAGTNSPVDQFWLKLGVGHGTVKYADASAASGCSCLGAAKGSGVAQQLQVSYERHLSADTVVFGQLGRVWLPSASSALVAGAQSEHAKLTVNAASLGVRYVFR